MSKPDYFLGGQGADIEMHKEVKKSRTHSGDKAPCPRLGFSPFLDVLAGVGGPKVYTLEHIASKVFSSYSSNLQTRRSDTIPEYLFHVDLTFSQRLFNLLFSTFYSSVTLCVCITYIDPYLYVSTVPSTPWVGCSPPQKHLGFPASWAVTAISSWLSQGPAQFQTCGLCSRNEGLHKISLNWMSSLGFQIT